jgi:hypothetical protein
MFWFISPWEAARRSLEVQGQLMAFPWIFLASGRRYQGLADRKQDPYEARHLRAPWLLQVQQQSPPVRLWKVSRGLLALVGKTRGLKERTRAVRNELT